MGIVSETSQLTYRAVLTVYSHWLRGAVTLGPSRLKVALTFDDGPDPRWTPQILEILAEHQAHATFFMLGAHLERYPDLARKVASAGHDLAVHLFSHDTQVADDDRRFREELTRSVELISAAGGTARFLRFPFAYLGRQHPRRIRQELGLTTIHWTFSSMDSRFDARGIEQRIERKLMPGAIVLMHDGVGANSKYVKTRQATVDALPGVLATCERRGLAAVGLSDLIEGLAEK